MKRFTSALTIMLCAIPVLLGANEEGCEPRVRIGTEPDDPECITTGCGGEACAEEPISTTCEERPEHACLPLSNCEVQDTPEGDRVCGWTQTPEYLQCLADIEVPEDPECLILGCSNQICAEESLPTDCEYLPEYACLSLSECAPQDTPEGLRACGWTQTPEYLQCLADLEDPEDPVCMTTGCSGEICAEEPISSACEDLPEFACLPLTNCTAQDTPEGGRACGWTQTPEYLQCLEDLP